MEFQVGDLAIYGDNDVVEIVAREKKGLTYRYTLEYRGPQHQPPVQRYGHWTPDGKHKVEGGTTDRYLKPLQAALEGGSIHALRSHAARKLSNLSRLIAYVERLEGVPR